MSGTRHGNAPMPSGLQDPYASAGGGYDPYAAEAPQQAAYGAPQQYGGAEYGAPAAAPGPAAGYGGQGPPPSAERGGPPVPKEQREGDWTCTCGNTNFSWRCPVQCNNAAACHGPLLSLAVSGPSNYMAYQERTVTLKALCEKECPSTREQSSLGEGALQRHVQPVQGC